jgi:hypothetical protein
MRTAFGELKKEARAGADTNKIRNRKRPREALTVHAVSKYVSILSLF